MSEKLTKAELLKKIEAVRELTEILKKDPPQYTERLGRETMEHLDSIQELAEVIDDDNEIARALEACRRECVELHETIRARWTH